MDEIGEIILAFVSRYDVPFRYDEAVGALWQLNCFEEPSPEVNQSAAALTNFVGACYCAMIREDVHLHLAEGIQWIRRSRRAWNLLFSAEQTSDGTDFRRRYILARWQDACGRVLYRTGNYTLARNAFEKALDIIADPRKPSNVPPIYWCWPDIFSNFARTKFEIARQYGSTTKESPRVRLELDGAIKWTCDSYPNETDVVRRKELLRGLASCLHNWLTCDAPAGPDRDRRRAMLDELLTGECKDDIYRRAQVLTWDGLAAKKRNPSDAPGIYEQLLQSRWPRGRFFARQHLAHLHREWEKLLALCEEVEADVLSNGGFDAVDIDRYHWTLTFAEGLVPMSQAPARERLRTQQRSITRALSGIVSVAAYRSRFEEMLRPRLRQLGLELMAGWKDAKERSAKDMNDRFDALVDNLEEFGLKEVLEVLRSKTVSTVSAQYGVNVIPFVIDRKPAMSFGQDASLSPITASGQKRNVPPLVPVVAASEETGTELAEQAAQRRIADEEYWLANPLRIRERAVATSQRARQQSLVDQGRFIVRFAILGAKENERVYAFWWWRGRSGMTVLPDALPLARILRQADSSDPIFLFYEEPTRIPNAELAKGLWDTFLKPCVFEASPTEVKRITIALDAELYHVPLNFAWVPASETCFVHTDGLDQPLGLVSQVDFTLNLTAHLIDARQDLNYLIRDEQDDLWILEHDDLEGGFPRYMASVIDVVDTWGPLGRHVKGAGKEELGDLFRNRREFVMFACHGATHEAVGPWLELRECALIAYNLAHSVAMTGNKLLILGACESARPETDSYARLVGAFIAAGAGAVLASPCRPFIPTVCDVAAQVLNKISAATDTTVKLTAELREAALAKYQAYRRDYPHIGQAELKLWAASYQIWL